MSNYCSTKTPKRLTMSALAIVAVIGLSACASTPEAPTRELEAAQSAIASAEQARVSDLAPAELKAARDKLSAAKVAVQQKDMVLARYLASESTANAQLASAKAQMLKSKAVNDEMQKSIETLKQELQRSTGVQR